MEDSRQNNDNNINKLAQWRSTLDSLRDSTGITFKEVAEYAGLSYNEDGAVFYLKLPRKRRTYIGIGMAYGQPAEVINEWITYFAGKRRLYIKDISEDLVWIYLINENLKDKISGTNYFSRYEEYQSSAFAVFSEMWTEIVQGIEDTADVEMASKNTEHGEGLSGLRSFVSNHLDAFKTAYSKPRKYLDRYITEIVRVLSSDPERKNQATLNSLRGYLDDGMINFLTGDSETVHVLDKDRSKHIIRIKYIPKGKKKHVSLCLSLGMTGRDIDEYLDLMGYAPLRDGVKEERTLLEFLDKWEVAHTLQRTFKEGSIKNPKNGSSEFLDASGELKAVREMLELKDDLIAEYKACGLSFPYSAE